jgi:hypothetical protein
LTAGGVQRQQDQLGAGQGEQMVVPPGSESSRQEVAVTSFDSTTGPFEITVEEAAVSDLGPGSTAFGTIAAAGDLAVFRVAIAGGTPVVVDITPTLAAGADGPSSEGEKPRLDVQVELLDPRGIRTAVDTDGAGQPERVQVSGVDGQYLVIVRGYTTTTGQFDIAANRVRRALASGQRTTGEIDVTDVAEFTYELTPGGSYAALAIQPGPDFDPILEIAGPGGGFQTMDNGGAGSVEVGVMGPTEGPYLVTVTGYESSTGRFSLEVVALDQTLTEGRAETGHIVGAAVAPFVFETPGASPVVVALDAGPGLDPVLEIVGPTGQIFTVDNDATRSEFALLGGPPATYVLAVRWYQPSTGDFELAADATVPSPLEPGDSVSASGPMVFDVETPAGDGLELTATAASANTDVGIHVNDASGFPIDRLSSEGEPVSVTLAGESSYQVLVWSSGPAGDYTVTLSSAGVAAE